MYFNGFTLLCCIITLLALGFGFDRWSKSARDQLACLVMEDRLNEANDAITRLQNENPGTCCNCGNDDDGPYPVCLDCLMQITGVAPTEMSLSEIVTELDRVVSELPPQRSAEWDRLMRGVNGG